METRLFRLLAWLCQRYGRVSRRRVSLSFQERNLTHRQQAEIAGMTRVTVTQALSHYGQAEMMVRAGNDELLMGEGCRCFASLAEAKALADRHQIEYSWHRLHGALHGLTPLQVLQQCKPA